MAHDDAVLREAVEEILHQRAIVHLSCIVIGARKGWIDGKAGARRALGELCTHDIEEQRLWRQQPLSKRLIAHGLAHPGVGRLILYRSEKAITDDRIKLHMLMAIDEVGRA